MLICPLEFLTILLKIFSTFKYFVRSSGQRHIKLVDLLHLNPGQ